MKEVILAKSAGFCFGVQRAMDTVYAEADKKNVYTYGPIIHNTEVVNELESKGVKAVNDISEIPEPEKSTVIIRSHGVSKAVYESIKNSGAKIVDATCPFVLKIHKIVKDASAEGDQIVIIGNEKHPEVEGIMGWSETPVHVVDTVEKAEKLKLDKSKNARVVSQTTFNYTKFEELVEIFSKKGCRRSKIVLDFLCKESYDLRDFVALVSYLRSPNGCPWDQVQTHESIRRNFLEEAYEACEAIDAGDLVHMREELGDVLMQVLFHTDIEREAGHFDIDDVADAACKKLVYRHPHVFRRDEPDAPDWDTMKQRERAQTTTAEAMDSVARSLPALWRCDKIQAKAAKTGFEWPDVHAALDKVDEESRELRAAVASGDTEAIGDELGDLLFAAVKVARFAGIDPEQAAHAACEKFIRRFSAMETAAANDGTALEQCTLAQMLSLWQQAKQTVSAEQESRKSARQ